MKKDMNWCLFLAEEICQRFPEIDISVEDLEEFIEKKFLDKKYELSDEIGKLTILARKGDDNAAKKIIHLMAQKPPIKEAKSGI